MTLQRYLARLIAWCMAPLVVLAVGLGYWQFERVRDDSGADAQRLAQQLAESVDRVLQTREAGLLALAASPLITDESRWPELHRELRDIARLLGGAILLVDAKGRMRLHSDVPIDEPLPQSEGRAAVPLVFETGRTVVGDVVGAAITGEPQVSVAAPVRHGGRIPYGVVQVLPVSSLVAVLDSLTLPPGWELAVVDTQGKSIAHRGGEGMDAVAVMRFVAQPSLVPWTTEVRVPQASHRQYLWGVAMLIGLLLLGATGLSVLGGTWATRRLTRSLRSLALPGPWAAAHAELDEIRQTRQIISESRAAREAALESLRVREAQLRDVFASASEAIITTDAAQTIVMANPAAAQVFGWRLEQMVGQPLDLLLPERLRQAHRGHVVAFGVGDQTARRMGRLVPGLGLHADGHEFAVEAAISQVRTDGQQLFTVILRDVTERQEAQATIEEGRARLQATLESLDDALAIADTRRVVIDVNAAFLRMFGFASKADCLRPIADFESVLEISTPAGERIPLDEWSMARALRGEHGSGIETQVRNKQNGRAWTGSFSFAPIRGSGGEIVGGVCSVRDVSEQKQLADELRASHRDLERLLAAQTGVQEEERRRIARELHDELQQVLAAIKLDIGSILATLSADPRRLQALVTRMDDLATAAITSSRRIVNDLRPQMLEDVGLVAALEQLAAQFMERRPIRVRVECEEACRDGGEPQDAIALCLYRVAQEALNNVAKHARARRVHMQLSRTPEGGWALRIADDGRGLGDGDRRKRGSFGLRGMVERVRALGGELVVDSPGGRGVVVTARVGPRAVPDSELGA